MIRGRGVNKEKVGKDDTVATLECTCTCMRIGSRYEIFDRHASCATLPKSDMSELSENNAALSKK